MVAPYKATPTLAKGEPSVIVTARAREFEYSQSPTAVATSGEFAKVKLSRGNPTASAAKERAKWLCPPNQFSSLVKGFASELVGVFLSLCHHAGTSGRAQANGLAIDIGIVCKFGGVEGELHRACNIVFACDFEPKDGNDFLVALLVDDSPTLISQVAKGAAYLLAPRGAATLEL